jgi:hypothetical protein
VSTHADPPDTWAVASAIAEEVDDDDAVSGRDERDHLGPEVSRGREAVNQDDGLAGAARAGGVVIEACAVEVDKLAPHGEGTMADTTGCHKQRQRTGEEQATELIATRRRILS